MIDLHLHTTASDGRCTPDELVRQAVAVGLRTIAVTDHDTMAGVAPAARAAAAADLEFVAGVEFTATCDGRDFHLLGYYLDPESATLRQALDAQRAGRAERAREIARRLAALGVPIDAAALLARAPNGGGKSIARPMIAQALVEAGHVASIAEAFDRFLTEGGPAYVPHQGRSPESAVELIRREGGVAAMAHPGTTKRDEVIPRLVEAGLVAIEAFHSAHDAETQERYLRMARSVGLAVCGGSDYHGPGTRRAEFFGTTSLPPDEYAAFRARAGRG